MEEKGKEIIWKYMQDLSLVSEFTKKIATLDLFTPTNNNVYNFFFFNKKDV